ncbi:MAG: hypothetical protein WCO60_12820 [Verrucomicrobiota bacterium]
MSLSPSIQAAIDNFGKRRRKLLRLRILLAGSGILLSGTLGIALLDRLLVLPDALRLTLSSLLYLSVGVGCWVRGARFARHPNDPRTVARQIEAVAPSPHGHFLAAVEFSLNPDALHKESHEFHSLLQTHAETHASGLNFRQLLPRLHLKRDLQLATGAAILVGALFLYKGNEFGILCIRALLPTVNLPRISQFQIAISAPTPAEGMFPEGEKITLTVDVSGPTPTVPSIEILSHNLRSVSPLRPTSKGPFTAQIELGNTPLQYRIRAGDALTRYFQIQPVARPHAVLFQKRYHSPNYTHAIPRSITEEDGSLSAITDSVVDLEIRVDQPVQSALLNMEQGAKPESIPLTPTGAPDVFQCRLPIKENGSYHLELVSSNTGFASRPTPQFEIRAIPDAPPTLTFETPTQDLTLAIGETLKIRGHAEDDIELAYFAQAFRINQDPWTEVSLLTSPHKEADVERNWDPLADKAKPGDIVGLKLVALDSKGQRTESRIVQVTLAPSGNHSAASKALASHREIQEQLQSLQLEAQEATRALVEVKTQTESKNPDMIRRDQALVSAQRALENAVQKAASARAQLAGALRAPTDTQTERDLLKAAQFLNRIQLGSLETARQALSESKDGASLKADDKKEALRLATDSAAQAANRSNLLSESFKAQLAVRETQALAENTHLLAMEQGELARLTTPSPDTPSPAAAATERRQQVNEAAVRGLHQELTNLAERAPQAKERLNSAKVDLRKARGLLEKSLTTPAPDGLPEQTAASLELQASLDRTENTLTSILPTLNAAASKARETLERESASASQRLEQLRNELSGLEHRPNLTTEAKSAQSAIRTASEAATLQADANLFSSGEITEKRLAPDLATAARALRTSVQDNQKPKETADRTAQLAKALKPLEAALKTEELAQTASQLTKDLPDETEPLPAAQKEGWKTLQKDLQKLTAEAKASGLPEDTTEKLRQTNNSEAIAKIKAAPDSNEPAARITTEEANQLAVDLREASDRNRETVSAARSALAQLAPSAAQEFKRLAQEAASASANTNRLEANNTGTETSAPLTPQSLSEAQKAEAKLNRNVAAARDSLTQEANQQDASSAEGRERIRDADGASALLRDANKAAETLEKAAKTKDPDTRSALLKQAAEQQARQSKRLAQIGEHMENVESENSATTAQSRKALRESEKEAGVSGQLAAAQKRASELADLANASPNEAKAALEALTQSTPNKGAETSQKPGSPEENQSLKRALDSLQKEGSGANSLSQATKNAIAAAAQSNQNANRSARVQQTAQNSSDASASGASPAMGNRGGASSTESALPSLDKAETGDWGKLPKRLATDLMEGRRERSSGEYQGAIESYFRAVAEKARQTRDSK